MVDSSIQRLSNEFPSVEWEVLEIYFNEEAQGDYGKARELIACMLHGPKEIH